MEFHDILRDADAFTINSVSMNAELLTFQGSKYKVAEKSSKTQIRRRNLKTDFLMAPDSHNTVFQKTANSV